MPATLWSSSPNFTFRALTWPQPSVSVNAVIRPLRTAAFSAA